MGFTKKEILEIAKRGFKRDVAKSIKGSKQYFAIAGTLPKNLCSNIGDYNVKSSGKNITGGDFPVLWKGINSTKGKGIIIDFDKWFDWKYGDWEVPEIEAKFAKYLRGPKNYFESGGDVREHINEWYAEKRGYKDSDIDVSLIPFQAIMLAHRKKGESIESRIKKFYVPKDELNEVYYTADGEPRASMHDGENLIPSHDLSVLYKYGQNNNLIINSDSGLPSISSGDILIYKNNPYVVDEIGFAPFNYNSDMKVFGNRWTGKPGEFADGGQPDGSGKTSDVAKDLLWEKFEDTAFDIKNIGNGIYYVYMQHDATVDEVESRVEILVSGEEVGGIEMPARFELLGVDGDEGEKSGRQVLVMKSLIEGLYKKGGKVDDKWIQGAVEHKGILRRKAISMGLIKKDENLNEEALAKIEKISPVWNRRVELARTLKGMRNKNKMADGGDLFGNKIDKVTQLTEEVAIYVPSTTATSQVISRNELDSRTEEVKKYLSKLFGGYTSSEVLGGYVSRSGELVNEDIVKVTSFGSKDDFSSNKSKLFTQVKKWCEQWGQEAVGFEHEGNLYYIPETFAMGGDVKLLDNAYYGTFTLKGNRGRKYNIFQSHTESQLRQAVKQLFPGMDNAKHKELALEFKRKYEEAKMDYKKAVDAAFISEFGRPVEPTDYKVSGIWRDEFSEDTKDNLRHLLAVMSEYESAMNLHLAASKYADGGELGSKDEKIKSCLTAGELQKLIGRKPGYPSEMYNGKEYVKQLFTDKYVLRG